MKITLNPSECLSAVRPSPPPTCNTPKHAPSFPMLLHIIIKLSPRLLSLQVFFFFGFYLDRKTPEVFLVGNSWRGMLLREQGVRVESRFSGSSLTPCSAIPSRARCHDPLRVRTRRGVRKLSPVLAQPDPGVLVVTQHLCSTSLCPCVSFLLLPYIPLCFFNFSYFSVIFRHTAECL